MAGSVLDRIVEIKDTQPKKQRMLCNYVALHYSRVTMMTVAELATQAGVGTTTVMRLMQLLGYESYQRFKKDLMKDVVVRDSALYIDMKQTLSSQGAASDSALLSVTQVMPQVAASLMQPANSQQFEAAIRLLLEAEVIYILGYRSSFAVAQYFQDSVHLFLRKVVQLSTTQEFLYDNLLHLRPRDVLFVISEWPCTKKTVVFAELCHKRGVPVVLLTNTSANPIARFADASINTNSVGVQAGRLPSLLAIEALVQELGRRTKPQSIEMLSALESMLKENGIVLWEQDLPQRREVE